MILLNAYLWRLPTKYQHRPRPKVSALAKIPQQLVAIVVGTPTQSHTNSLRLIPRYPIIEEAVIPAHRPPLLTYRIHAPPELIVALSEREPRLTNERAERTRRMPDEHVR